MLAHIPFILENSSNKQNFSHLEPVCFGRLGEPHVVCPLKWRSCADRPQQLKLANSLTQSLLPLLLLSHTLGARQYPSLRPPFPLSSGFPSPDSTIACMYVWGAGFYSVRGFYAEICQNISKKCPALDHPFNPWQDCVGTPRAGSTHSWQIDTAGLHI